ncbi:MAG TPA: rhomboid family intramembrane serine protease [Planctomycetota bacterium]
MFLPIGDENPREKTPYVNYAILAANIAVFLFIQLPSPDGAIRWAMRPASLEPVTLFTSMFLHAGLLHLAGNMLFLWICGDNVEDRLGHVGYALFYLAWGLAAAFAHVFTTTRPEIPTLGASGAISGVLAAYVVFFPRHRIKMLLWLWIYVDTVLIPAWAWIGFWFAEQIFLSSRGMGGGVAYGAHIGGFVAGLAVALPARLLMASRRPDAPLPEGVLRSSRDFEGPLLTLDDPDIAYLDDPGERCAVLFVGDDLHAVRQVATAVAAATGESPGAVARRLEATRGVVARRVSRTQAERVQRDLRRMSLPTAIVPDTDATSPPAPVRVEGAGWDEEALRLRAGGREYTIPWSSPFLYVGARVEGAYLLDVFVDRHTAFRFEGKPGAVARAVLENRRGAVLNEGVRVLAHWGGWGWLSFRTRADYDDYVFWLYNLVLSRVPIHRGPA